jgi:hypothetical protein
MRGHCRFGKIRYVLIGGNRCKLHLEGFSRTHMHTERERESVIDTSHVLRSWGETFTLTYSPLSCLPSTNTDSLSFGIFVPIFSFRSSWCHFIAQNIHLQNMKSFAIFWSSSAAFFATNVLGSSGDYTLKSQTGCSNWESLEIVKYSGKNVEQCPRPLRFKCPMLRYQSWTKIFAILRSMQSFSIWLRPKKRLELGPVHWSPAPPLVSTS